VETEDLRGPISKDEDGEDGDPIFDDGDTMNYDMYNLDDETFESPNWNNKDLGVNC